MTRPSSKPFRPTPHWSIRAWASDSAWSLRHVVADDLAVDHDLGPRPGLDPLDRGLGGGDRRRVEHAGRVVDPLAR